MQKLNLPTPTNIEIQHSLKLVEVIKNYLEENEGVIPFDKFMKVALYEPCLGYYESLKKQFGEEGDFITAPEISPFFAQCFASVFQKIFSELDKKNILEFGAGRGKFAADCIYYLIKQGIELEHYYIVELSNSLKKEQQSYLKKHLPEFFNRIVWLDQLPESGFEGIIFANEVLDAMPVSIFEKSEKSGVLERTVKLDNERFVFDKKEPSLILREQVDKIESDVGKLPSNYCSEVNLWITPWIQSLYDSMEKGVVFLCDYGYPRSEYYKPERHSGTLQCYYKHHVHDDPFVYPGLQDITAHVDFTAVAEAVEQVGFDLEGFQTQMQFLSLTGEKELQELLNAPEQEKLNILAAVKRLMMPEGMGEVFKVISFSKNYKGEIECFDQADLSYTL